MAPLTIRRRERAYLQSRWAGIFTGTTIAREFVTGFRTAVNLY